MKGLERYAYRSFVGIMSVIIVFSMIIPVSSKGNDVYDQTYVGVDEEGLFVENTKTAVLKLKDDNSNTSFAYCADLYTKAKINNKYSRVNVDDSDYYSKESADKIRAIVRNSYPFISISEVQNRSNINNISKKEAITGTQMAIWHYANGKDFTNENQKVKNFYNFLINLPAADNSKKRIANIDIISSQEKGEEKYNITYKFKADSKNEDGSDIKLNYRFNKDISKEYKATVEDKGIDEQGNKCIKVSNLPDSARFTFTAYGTQNIGFDGYFYSPEGGKETSQSLVGGYSGKTNISKDAIFNGPVIGSYGVKINKLDSVTLKGLANVTYKLANTELFDKEVYSIKTNEDGVALKTDLKAGTWYLKEVDPPKGYIPYTSVIKVSVGEGITELNLKNVPYGSIEIKKVDENKNTIKGAEFSIYSGDKAEGEPLFKNLLSNDEGIVFAGNIVPGTYTVLETNVPRGYHLNLQPVVIEVTAGNTNKFEMINNTIKKGALNIYKKDAISKEQIEGAVIGVYSDENFENLVKEVTTFKDKAALVEDLMPGTYYVRELSVPDGYLKDAKDQTVELKEGETKAITFFNSRIYPTAGNYGIILIIGLVMLAGSTSAVIFGRKYFKNNKSK